jgi:hypothetical protein
VPADRLRENDSPPIQPDLERVKKSRAPDRRPAVRRAVGRHDRRMLIAACHQGLFMKRSSLACALALAAVPAFAQTTVGVSVYVDQPGVYGRIDIGRAPAPPVLIYPQPIIVQHRAAPAQQPPIYLHVPPGHAKHWSKHCGRYNACGHPVYFVQNTWYEQHYVPAQRHPADGPGKSGKDHGKGPDHGKGHGGKPG